MTPSLRTRFTARGAVLCALFSVLLCGGCPDPGGSAAPKALTAADIQQTTEDILIATPSRFATVQSFSPGANGPAGSLAAMNLAAGAVCYVMGTEDATGNVDVTGLVLEDADGAFLYRTDVGDDWMKITLPTGDTTEFALEPLSDAIRVTLTTPATIPPSQLVFFIEPSGHIDPVEAFFGGAENPDYGRAMKSLPRKAKSGPTWQTRDRTRCESILGGLDKLASGACFLKGLFGTAIERSFALVACNDAMEALVDYGSRTADDRRAAGKVRLGLNMHCVVFQWIGKAGKLASKLTPLDAACVLLDFAESGALAATGESIETVFCGSVFGLEPAPGDPNSGDGANPDPNQPGNPPSDPPPVVVGRATAALFPAEFLVDVNLDPLSPPALRAVVFHSYVEDTPYYGYGRYVRADGANPNHFLTLGLWYPPPSVGGPHPACGRSAEGEIVTLMDGCRSRQSTKRTITAIYCTNTLPIRNEAGEHAKNEVLDELIRAAVDAGVGVACD